MPEYVPSSLTTKLTLLFLFDKMEIPLTENSILDICTNRNNWITYMECKEALQSLINSGLIYIFQTQKDSSNLYAISRSGRECLSLFFQQVPMSLRDDISSFAKLNIQHIKRIQEYTSKYTKMPDGSYLNTFSIRDPHFKQSLFEIKMKFDTRTEAINASKKWVDKAPEIYESVFLSLITETD